MRSYLVGLVIAVCVVGVAGPAAAGDVRVIDWSSGTGLDRQYVAAGQTMVLQGDAFFPTAEQLEAAEATTYYAYLVRGFDRALLRRAKAQIAPARWWALTDGAEVVRVGATELVALDGNVADCGGHARSCARTQTELRIPRVKPGRYHLMLCDAGCTTPLGFTVPSPVRVVADPAVARTSQAVKRWNEQMTEVEQRLRFGFEELGSLRGQLRVAESKAEEAEAEAAEAQRQADVLAARVSALEQPKPAEPPWAWFAAGLLALIAAFALGRRSGAAGPDRGDDDDSQWERPARLTGSGRS